MEMRAAFTIAALVVIATATAMPSADEVVPEMELAQVGVRAFEEAQTQIKELLKSGKSSDGCAALAAATIKEVEEAVEGNQKILDALDTGADCPKEGQAEVDSAQSGLEQANQDKQDADNAVVAAANADINFAPMALDGLKPGQCGLFFNDPAYLAAKQAKQAADKAAIEAAGAVTAAQTTLKAAKDAQKNAISDCECSVKNAYATAWEAANANNDADKKAYTKGKHMQCVLEGTPAASCNVGAIPKVTAITLADGVESAENCEVAPTKGAKVTCQLTIDNVLDSVKYNGQDVAITGPKSNWNANKVVTFDSVANGILEVTGHDSEGGNNGHCKTAGFAIQCQSEDSFWGAFNSGSTAIQAAGGKDANAQQGYRSWRTPCTSTSGFSLPANRGLKKLWAPDGERWAKFQMGPSL